MSEGYCEECGGVVSEELGGACAACLWGVVGGEEAGDYEFGEEIARGGMGGRTRARQRRPEREVAVKMLAPRLLDEPGLRERFANEARVAASLDHVAILPVYAVGERDGVPFFAMKLADGGTLAERLKAGGAMAAREAAGLVAELAEAVGYAHGRGVLHRDLKPGNVLFDTAGRVYVSDFGLAKVVGEDAGAEMTRSLAILGTPQYLPPEIAGGSMREASTAGDVYSLGAMLYELLAGRPPFVAETVPGLLRRIADEGAEEIEGLGIDLRAVVGKCLEKEPEKRYRSALALAEDLRAWLAGRPVRARVPGAAGLAWRWARRNPVVAGLGVCVVVLLVLGAVLQQRANAKLSDSLADSLLSQAGLVRRGVEGVARGKSLGLLRESVEIAGGGSVERAARQRGESAAALALASMERVEQWAIPGAWNLVSPVFSEDLSRYVAPAEGGGFAVYDTASKEALAVSTGVGDGGWPFGKFASDAAGLVVAATAVNMETRLSRTEVVEVLGDGGGGTRLGVLGVFEAEGTEGAVPVIFDDGTLLVVRDGRLWRGRDAGALEDFPLEAGTGKVVFSTLALSGDGERLAAAVEEPAGVAVWRVGVAEAVWRSGLTSLPQALAWSADGGRLAFAEGGEAPVGIAIADAASGEIVERLPGHGSAVATVAFHPDGDSVVSVGFDGWVVWQSAEARGFSVRLPANPGPLGFDAGGERLAYSPARGMLALAELAAPVGWRRWRESRELGTITCVESTGDGRRVVVATLEGLELWDAEAGARLDSRGWMGKEVRWPWFRIVPGGEYLVCSDSNVAMTRWPILDGRFGEPEEVVKPGGGTNIIHDFSQDGDWLVSGEREQREASAMANFYVWPGGDPARARLVAGAAQANGLQFIGRESGYVIGFHSHRADAFLWECESGREARSLGHPEPVFLGVDPGGGRVCTVGAHEGWLWDSRSWSGVATWSQEGAGKCVPVFSPGGGYFATTSPSGRVSIREALAGVLYLELEPPRDLSSPELVWLGEGRVLLASGLDGLWEWDLEVLRVRAEGEGVGW